MSPWNDVVNGIANTHDPATIDVDFGDLEKNTRWLADIKVDNLVVDANVWNMDQLSCFAQQLTLHQEPKRTTEHVQRMRHGLQISFAAGRSVDTGND